jgi:hypothetical protein
MSICSAIFMNFADIWANWVIKRRAICRQDALGNFPARKALLVELVLRTPMHYYPIDIAARPIGIVFVAVEYSANRTPSPGCSHTASPPDLIISAP